MSLVRTFMDQPIGEQRVRRMLPGEDCPDCVWCGGGLHEATPRLVDVLDAVAFCDTTKLLVGTIDVVCPHCEKPNEVRWHVDVDDNTWDAESASKETAADREYLRMRGARP